MALRLLYVPRTHGHYHALVHLVLQTKEYVIKKCENERNNWNVCSEIDTLTLIYDRKESRKDDE